MREKETIIKKEEIVKAESQEATTSIIEGVRALTDLAKPSNLNA